MTVYTWHRVHQVQQVQGTQGVGMFPVARFTTDLKVIFSPYLSFLADFGRQLRGKMTLRSVENLAPVAYCGL